MISGDFDPNKSSPVKGKLFSKVKISLVSMTRFEFSHQKLDSKLRENDTVPSIPNLERRIFNNFKRAKLQFAVHQI